MQSFELMGDRLGQIQAGFLHQALCSRQIKSDTCSAHRSRRKVPLSPWTELPGDTKRFTKRHNMLDGVHRGRVPQPRPPPWHYWHSDIEDYASAK